MVRLEVLMDDIDINNLKQQLEWALAARARWEATANILAGQIQKHMGTSEMYKLYERHALHWAWDQTANT